MKTLDAKAVKSQCRSFDAVATQSMQFRGLGLEEIGESLLCCEALTKLDLSDNKLSNTRGIPVAELRELHLENNQLTDWDLPPTKTLRKLYLQGNGFISLTLLDKLGKAYPQLTHLFLANLDGSNGNPLCKELRYKEVAQKYLPSLTVLDGERLHSPYNVMALSNQMQEQSVLLKLLKEIENDERRDPNTMEDWFEDMHVDDLFNNDVQQAELKPANDAFDSALQRGDALQKQLTQLESTLKRKATEGLQ